MQMHAKLNQDGSVGSLFQQQKKKKKNPNIYELIRDACAMCDFSLV